MSGRAVVSQSGAKTVRDASSVGVDIRRGFNSYLHGARGLFAFMIVAFHVVNSGLATLPALSSGVPLMLMRSMEHGVELFFGISGIVIVGALQRARGPLVFAIERATRIYPVLWVSILVIAVLAGLTGFEGRGWPSAHTLVANLLALPPLIPGPIIHPAAWSLSYELSFYGLCAVVWFLRRRLGPWVFAFAAMAAGALLFFHLRAVLMPIGMAAAVLLERRPSLAKWVAAPGVAFLVFLVFWELFCRSHGGDLMATTLADVKGWDSVFMLVAMTAAMVMFLGVLAGRGLFSSVLRTSPFQFLGTVSYSLYLWHPIVMSVVKHVMYVLHLPARLGSFSQAAFFILILPPSLIVAWASQATLERHVTRWLRRKLEPRRPSAQAPITAAHDAQTSLNAPTAGTA